MLVDDIEKLLWCSNKVNYQASKFSQDVASDLDQRLVDVRSGQRVEEKGGSVPLKVSI